MFKKYMIYHINKEYIIYNIKYIIHKIYNI